MARMEGQQAGTGVRGAAGAERARTTTGWSDTRHSFSFGAHYDPGNTHFALLVASNDDVVAAGSGYDTHPHRDVEILTWVLEGALLHRDSAGSSGAIRPGEVPAPERRRGGAALRARRRRRDGRLGTADDTRFVQMWVLPDTTGARPTTRSPTSPARWAPVSWWWSPPGCRATPMARDLDPAAARRPARGTSRPGGRGAYRRPQRAPLRGPRRSRHRGHRGARTGERTHHGADGSGSSRARTARKCSSGRCTRPWPTGPS